MAADDFYTAYNTMNQVKRVKKLIKKAKKKGYSAAYVAYTLMEVQKHNPKNSLATTIQSAKKELI